MVLAETLHKTLPGTVLAEKVRCGRANCRCRDGSLHGPYYFRYWRENGVLRKEYVRHADLEQVRAQCEARRQFHRELAISRQELRRISAFLKGLKRS